MSLWLIIAPLFIFHPFQELRTTYTASPPVVVSQTATITSERVEPTPTPIPTRSVISRPSTTRQVVRTSMSLPNWDALLQQYFGENWVHAKTIMLCESSGNQEAVGPTDSKGYNPIGLFQIKDFVGRPSTADLKIGSINIAYAASMSGGGTNWSAWECK